MDSAVAIGLLFSAIWFLCGIIFLITGTLMLKSQKKKEKNCTEKTYGKVIDIVRLRNTGGGSSSGQPATYHPVFEYRVGDLTFVKQSLYGSTLAKNKYAIGQDVEILYNPNNGNEYLIVGFTSPKTIATIFTVVGIVVTAISFISAIIMAIL